LSSSLAVQFDPTMTLADARRVYFEANGFPADGGYDAPWVDFELGPIPMPFPNTDGRRRAINAWSSLAITPLAIVSATVAACAGLFRR
jgi:hypothetical protein